MKARHFNRRGSALITVVMLCGLMAILAASMLRYTISERRGNERNRLILRAKNVAENVTIYAAEQLSTKLYRQGSATNMPSPGPAPRRTASTPRRTRCSTALHLASTARSAPASSPPAAHFGRSISPSQLRLQVSTAKVPIHRQDHRLPARRSAPSPPTSSRTWRSP